MISLGADAVSNMGLEEIKGNRSEGEDSEPK